jgi:predicted O-linked N-acetylglucosamine transferase (SPINDLY family)
MATPDTDSGLPTERVFTLPEAVREAMALQGAGRLAEAKYIFEAVVAKAPAHAHALHQLGLIAAADGDLPSAIRRLSQAVEAQPGFVEAHSNLGALLLDYGEPERAVDACRAALRLQPNFAPAHRNLLHGLLYLPGLDAEQRFAAYRAFGARHEPPPEGVLPPPTNDRDPERRLRIGIVSSDLHAHPIALNILSVFEHHDRDATELLCYAQIASPGGLTDLFKARSDGWRDIAGLSDRAVAELIRSDAIDVLVIVAGSFDANRPLIACHRPAPIQVSLFDAATSGIQAMDYFVSDVIASPPGDAERFTERVVRLPLLVSYPPLDLSADIGPLPARDNGFVTFAGFHRASKISPPAIALWSRVLQAVPTARLALRYRDRFAEPMLRARFQNAFMARGVAPDRILFPLGENHYLDAYRSVDIALDTLPFGGVTVTFDSLKRGVPVVTLSGDTVISRMSASILVGAGLGALVARSSDAYVQIAVDLAADLDRLAALRAGLRTQVSASPLCDGPAYARSVEQLWRSLWRAWCATAAVRDPDQPW